MQQLRQCNYIAMRSNSVSVMLDPTELTIYDLFMVLPDGIPLGEETEHKHGEDYYAKAKYHHIKRLEDAAAASRT